MRWKPLGWAVVVIALLAAGCTGGRSEEATPASEAASTGAGAGSDVAALGILADDVAARDEGASEFLPAEDGTSLDVGDAVQTDAAGRAQLTYGDGSLTRIDSDSTFEVVELALEPLKAQLKLDAGRVWNRVQDLTETQGSFELETPVATAAVRGTAFTVECVRNDDACTFSVVEGLVEVTTITDIQVQLAAGESITVLADGSIEGVAVVEDDDWIAENLETDEGDGFNAVVVPNQPEGGGALASANISGVWNVTHTVSKLQPSIPPPYGPGSKELLRVWEVEQRCDAPCDATLVRSAVGDAKMSPNPDPQLSSAGGTYSYETEFGVSCAYDADNDGVDDVSVPVAYLGPVQGQFWVTRATVSDDGDLRATALAGRRSGTGTMTPEARAEPRCSDRPKRINVEWTSVLRPAGN